MSAKRVLVLNPGSSSLKASLVEPPDATLGRTEVSWGDDASRVADTIVGVREALRSLGLADVDVDLDGAGYRVVHGGATLREPVLVDAGVIAELTAIEELAPLHNGVALRTMAAGRALLPEVPHVACFDTAFHATLPEDAYRYAVPEPWHTDWGVRRYGFHGLSVAWSTRRAAELLGRPAEDIGLVVAHLGSGCSVTAVDGGRSVDTTMGMTPLEGLMMGTRSGSVDPGALMYLLESGRMGPEAMSEALEHDSGLAGVSGLGSDMRALEAAAAAGDPRALLAIAMFVRRAAGAIGAAATALSRLDAVVFTGGIGEHAAAVRERIVERLGALDVRHGNETGDGVPVLCIEAREDLVIAADTAALLES